MTLYAEYCVSDFREAHAAVRSQGITSINTIPLLYVFLAYTLGMIAGKLLQAQPPGVEPRGPADIIVSSLPLLVFSAYWGVVVLRTRGKRAHGFIVAPPRLTGVGVVIPALLCVAIFAIALIANAAMPVEPLPPVPAPPQSSAAAFKTLLFSFGPLVAIAVAEIWLFLKIYSGNIARTYELQVNLHRPTTITASPDAVGVADQTHQTRYDWSAFIGWHETKNLFLLYRSYISFVIVPKRSFQSPEFIYEFTQLIRQRIGERHHGFEPLPAQSPPVAASHG